jgi:hypothetical protein
MTKHRTINVQIPEPDKKGACNICCPLRIGYEGVNGCKLGVVCTFRKGDMFPGPGCPWHEDTKKPTKAHTRVRPCGDKPWEWAVDLYAGRGAWRGSSFHETKTHALRAAKKRIKEVRSGKQ